MPYLVIVHATFENKPNADHIHNQAIAVATHASVARIGEPGERTSHGFVAEELEDGSLQVLSSWHVDLFGIVRQGKKPEVTDTPVWIQPVGGHGAYPAQNVRGGDTVVSHNGKFWKNVHGNGNIWEPAEGSLWTEVIIDYDDTWVAPE